MAKSQILLATVLFAGASVVRADVNSWYPHECIAIDYCAPVQNIAWIAPVEGAAPQLVISSGNYKAVVQRTFPVSDSKDGNVHVCMRYDPFGNLEVTCLLIPIRDF